MILLGLSCVSSPPVPPLKAGADLRYAADFMVDVRGTPSSDAPAKKSLEIGTPMEVTGPEQGGWLPVKVHGIEGFVRSGDLTTEAGEQISPRDEEETWAVSWGPDGQPLLRVRTKARAMDTRFEPRELEVSVPITARFEGGTLTAGVDQWGAQTRFDITQCDAAPRTDGPRCATGSASTVFDDASQTVRLTPLTPVDAWQWSRESPSILDCKDPVELEVQVRDSPQKRLDLTMQSNFRGPNSHVVCSTFGQVASGEWKGKALVSCREVARDGATFARFIELAEDHWLHLGCQDQTRRDIAEALPWEKIRVTDAGPFVLSAPVRVPDVLWSDDVSQVVLRGHVMGSLPEGPVVFNHAVYGPVVRHHGPDDDGSNLAFGRAAKAGGELGFAHSEGGLMSYFWTPNSFEVEWEEQAPTAHRFRLEDPYFAVLNGQTSHFKKVGTLDGMDVYRHPNPASVSARFHRPGAGSVIVFVEDPWGGLVALVAGP